MVQSSIIRGIGKMLKGFSKWERDKDVQGRDHASTIEIFLCWVVCYTCLFVCCSIHTLTNSIDVFLLFQKGSAVYSITLFLEPLLHCLFDCCLCLSVAWFVHSNRTKGTQNSTQLSKTNFTSLLEVVMNINPMDLRGTEWHVCQYTLYF